MSNKKLFSVAIIGSFRQFYEQILIAWNIFTKNKIRVTSPKGAAIIDEGIPFVRFVSDSSDYDDCSIQSLTLHKIFSADVIYVVAPNGYIGRTTCYEIGRVIQAQKPIYFSAHPIDLPIQVSSRHILTPEALAKNILDPKWNPTSLFNQSDNLHYQLESDLINGLLWSDREDIDKS